MAKINKSDIDNLLIFSEDRWSLVEATVRGKTPSQWWTASKAFWEALPDGTVKSNHMPCALLYQVGEEDNQRAVCNSIDVTIDKGGKVTSAKVDTTITLQGKVYKRPYDMDPSKPFEYPFGMKSADATFSDPSAVDPDDFTAFADAISNKDVVGKFNISHFVVGTGGKDGANGGLTDIANTLSALNNGDMVVAADTAKSQLKSLSAEGVESPTYDPSSENPTTVPASPSGYEPAEMAAEDANIAPLDGPQGVGSGSPTAIGEGHGVTESFGKSTAPVPGTLLSAEGEDPSATGGPGPSPLDAPATPSDYEIDDLDSQIDAWMAETATHDPYVDEVPYEGPGDFSGSDVVYDAEIGKDVKRPGALTRKAKRAGMSVAAYAQHVLDNPKKFSKLTRQQAGFYHNVLAKGQRTSAERSKVRADMRRKGYMLAESQVTWEDAQGLSSPSSPPDDIFMADEEVDEIYGTGHIIGQTGSTWTTSPLAAEGDLDYAPGYGQDSAWPSSQGVPVWYGSAETFCADCGRYDAECGCYASESFNLPVVGSTDVKSAVIGAGIGIGLLALIGRLRK